MNPATHRVEGGKEFARSVGHIATARLVLTTWCAEPAAGRRSTRQSVHSGQGNVDFGYREKIGIRDLADRIGAL